MIACREAGRCQESETGIPAPATLKMRLASLRNRKIAEKGFRDLAERWERAGWLAVADHYRGLADLYRHAVHPYPDVKEQLWEKGQWTPPPDMRQPYRDSMADNRRGV